MHTQRRGRVILAALLMVAQLGLVSCGRRTVVDDVTGEPVDTPQTRIALLLSDFGSAFIAYGDAVVELRDDGTLDADLANRLIEINIQVVDAGAVAQSILREGSTSDGLLDALQTMANGFGEIALLLPEEGRLRTVFFSAEAYLTAALEVARTQLPPPTDEINLDLGSLRIPEPALA